MFELLASDTVGSGIWWWRFGAVLAAGLAVVCGVGFVMLLRATRQATGKLSRFGDAGGSSDADGSSGASGSGDAGGSSDPDGSSDAGESNNPSKGSTQQ